MPFAIGAIWTLIVGIVAGFISLVGRKGIVSAAALTAFVVTTAALIVCMNAFITEALYLIAIPSWLLTGLGMFIPSNFIGCVSAIFGAKSCRFAYDLAIKKINTIATAT